MCMLLAALNLPNYRENNKQQALGQRLYFHSGGKKNTFSGLPSWPASQPIRSQTESQPVTKALFPHGINILCLMERVCTCVWSRFCCWCWVFSRLAHCRCFQVAEGIHTCAPGPIDNVCLAIVHWSRCTIPCVHWGFTIAHLYASGRNLQSGGKSKGGWV